MVIGQLPCPGKTVISSNNRTPKVIIQVYKAEKFSCTAWLIISMPCKFNFSWGIQKYLYWQCTFHTAFFEIGMDEYLCIWLSVMQKLKNILGSRKKGAQEPQAAREPRYDYQGNTTSNLKGISLECLTLPVGMTSYSLCPLFYRSSIAYFCPSDVEHVRTRFVSVFFSPPPFRELAPRTGWVQEFGRRSHRYGLARQFHAATAHWRAGRFTLKIWKLAGHFSVFFF